MRFMILALSLALAACATSRPSASAIACPAERAVYTLRGEPGAQMRFMRTPHALNAYSDLAARVDFESDVYWFAFNSSLGYSRDYIGRIQDPFFAAAEDDAGEDAGEIREEPDFASSELISFDADYNVIAAVPRSGEPAPQHLAATGVGSSIWYSLPRRQLPKAVWDLTSCADAQS